MIRAAMPSVPDQVRAKLLSLLPDIRKKKQKGMICPAGGFTAALFEENLLSAEEITGLLDNDETKHGTLVAGFPVYPISSIESRPPDFVLVASMSFNKELVAQLQPFSRRHRFKLLDICSTKELTLQMPFVNSCLAPVPSIVQENLRKQIPFLVPNRSRVFLLQVHPLMLSLWLRGAFASLDVRGIIDSDRRLTGADWHGLTVYSPDQIDSLEADAILMADPRGHGAAAMNVDALPRIPNIINLCEGLTIEGFRSEWAECLARQIWANRLEELPVRKVQIWMPNRNMSDMLCGLSAAREFARRNPGLEVRFQHIAEVLEAYGDHLVRSGAGGYVIPSNADQFLNDRWSAVAGNYQGCHYLGIGLDFETPPQPELPAVPPIEGFAPQSYIALLAGTEGPQPVPSAKQLDSFPRVAPLPVVCIGDIRTGSRIRGAEYVDGSLLNMLRLIRHAAVVITSRSLSAHIAAGYGVPSVVWIPENDPDWHIDYPNWNHRRIALNGDASVDPMEELTQSLLCSGRIPFDARAFRSDSEACNPVVRGDRPASDASMSQRQRDA